MKSKESALSLNLCNISGIPIRIHVSFFLLLAWIAFDEFQTNGRPLEEVLFVLAVFACVLLHELGHALVAKRFQIQTRDIVLYPFGGIAALMGEARPLAELLIAIAGPLVNVFIAAGLAFFLDFSSPETFLDSPSVAARIFVANVVLVLFNMIPALPMDGGRVLRASLALMKVRRATLIASRLSQVLSVLMGLFALYTGNVILVIISMVVFTNALQERVHARARTVAEGFTVSDVMTDLQQLVTFTHGATISESLRLALKSLQQFFPVMLGRQVLGVVSRDDLMEAATSEDENYVSSIMDRRVPSIACDEPLAELVARFEMEGDVPLIALRGDEFVGMLTKDKLMEFLLVHGLRQERERIAESAPPEEL